MCNYIQTYTELRTGKMDFHEFMGIVNSVYEFGHQRGMLHGIEICKQDVEDRTK